MQNQNNRRTEYGHYLGNGKTAKLLPIQATPVLGGEAGLFRQTVNVKLAPIAGELRSSIYAKVQAVFVPVQAMHQFLLPSDPEAGITEVIRRKLLNGTSIDALEIYGGIAKRLNVHPISDGTTPRVSNFVDVGHAVACNYLRKRLYIYASQYTNAIKPGNTPGPALVHETVLTKFNAALDPDDHINGNVSLTFSETKAPVVGLSQTSNSALNGDAWIESTSAPGQITIGAGNEGVRFKRKAANPAGTALDIYADLDAIEAGGFSLVDLYQAEKADKLVRQMRQIADANPNDGEDAVLRWAFNLRADEAQHPFLIYEKRIPIAGGLRRATDAAGMETETMVSELMDNISFEVPVPSTELGGIIFTFLQVTPDETLLKQPHPILAGNWRHPNAAADSLKIDPVAVQYKQLFAEPENATQAAQVKFYTGHNELKRNYVSFGLSPALDPTTVENKTQFWQYAIPAGVSPENILYPENFPQYPFIDQNAEVVTYDVETVLNVATPLVYGPTPVERVAIVDDKNILGQ